MKFLILCILVLFVGAGLAPAGSSGLHYGHGIQVADTVVHFPTGDYAESGEWETITLRRSPLYPRHYFLMIVDWISSDRDPNPHTSVNNCNVFSPLDLHAAEL
jgi:hypothetical protein